MVIDKVILGIDPGTTITGFGTIKVEKKGISLIKMGIFDLSKLKTHELKLKRNIYNTIQDYLHRNFII